MSHLARITRYTKLSHTSPGWLSAAEFREMKAKTLALAEGCTEPVVDEYVDAWTKLVEKMNEKGQISVDFFTLQDDENFYTILLFETEAALDEMMTFLAASPEQARLLAAREQMATELQVAVSIFEKIPVDLEKTSFFTIDIIKGLIGGA